MGDGDSNVDRGRLTPLAADGGDPYPAYAWFREHDPVHVGEPGWPTGRPQVMVFRYADVMQGLKDPRMIRQFNKLPEVQALRKLQRWQPPGPDTFASVSRQYMLYQDPPEHTRLRTIANRAFAPRLVTDRRDEVERIAADLLHAFRETHGGEGDLIEAFAYPLPMLVMASILGIPHEDLNRFQAWSVVVGATADTHNAAQDAVQARVDEATRDLRDFLRSLVARRCEEPRDDFISRLVAARDDSGGRLTEDELITMCMLMITAGHETMVNVIANGTLALMRHRHEWDRLVADPSLASGAADELMRYDSPIQYTGRITGEDVEIAGVSIPRGSEVLFMLGSANRDERVWEDSDTVRIDRKPGRHMAFGMGVHFCMGVPLARLEAGIALQLLAREAPGLELTDPEPPWRPVVHGLQRLDVRL